MGKTTTQEPDLLAIDTVQELLDRGYRHVILSLLAEGKSQKAIRNVLREEYGVEVKPEVLGYAIKQKFGGAGPIYQAAMAREAATLHQHAQEEYHRLRKRYRDAEDEGEEDLMKLYLREMGRWWDRIFKAFHEGADRVEVEMKRSEREIDWLPIIIDELGDADPGVASRVLERMKEEEDRNRSKW